MFETGTQPVARATTPGRRTEPRPRTLYFHANGALVVRAADGSRTAFDEYVSDPAKPVPFIDGRGRSG